MTGAGRNSWTEPAAAVWSASAPGVIPCEGPAVRSWLVEHLPAQVEVFDREFADGIAHAGRTFDLGQVGAVVRGWWGLAWARANITPAEIAMLERVERGDLTGLSTFEADGTPTRV